MALPKSFVVFGEVAPLLVNYLNYSFKVEELSSWQKQAIITLIEKKGRDKRLVKYWRPISLMKLDTKVASMAPAHKMLKSFLIS